MTETQKKFLEKFNALYNSYKTKDQEYPNIADPVKSVQEKHRSIFDFEKMTELFKRLVYALPEEHRTTAHSVFEEKYKAFSGNDRYAGYIKLVNDPKSVKYPTAEAKKYHLCYLIPQVLMRAGDANDIVAQAVEHLDDNTLEGLLSEIENFRSDVVDNIKVEFFRKRVEELKAANETRVEDRAQREALNEELEIVAKTVITSTARYGSEQGEAIDAAYRTIGENRIDELNEKSLSTPEFQHFRGYFDVDMSGKYRGTRSVSNAHREDTEMADVFTADNVKMTFTDKTKDSMRKVFAYMRSHNMFRDDANIGEQGTKIYGFAPICEAHEKLKAAIEGTDVDAIREARMQYETELQNMRGLYELIKKEFNPPIGMMVGNINTYRTEMVPNEFKNDILLNALVSGFFNLNAALAQQKSDLEQMFENPNKVFLQILKGFAANITAGAYVEGQNIAQAIKTLTVANSNRKFPATGLPRNIEFLQALTYGSEAFEKNSLGSMLFTSYASYVGNIVFDTEGDSLNLTDYLVVSPVETLANVFLVNDEDRDYNRLRAANTMTIDCTEKIPAFDTMKYLETHTIDAGALINRFKDTLTELSEQKYFQRNANETKYTAIADTVRAAQFAAYQFLMVHPEPEECDPGITDENEIARITKENERIWEELRRIVNEPEVVFADQIEEKTKEALDKRLPKHKMFDAETKAKINAARIAQRKAEQEYDNKTRALRDHFADVCKQFGTGIGPEADKVRADYTKTKAELAAFVDNECKRLKEAYVAGEIPVSYYEQRRRDIRLGTVNNFIPFGAEERMTLARDESRKAEKAYEKQAASLIKQVNNLSKRIGKGDEKVEQQYAQAQKKLNELKAEELKRLDKAYADGKLTQSYYDERRFNVETDNLQKKVPFGLDEAPTEKQFKAQYKNELKSKELGEDEVQMLYERMMHRMRIDDFKFKQVASGGYPKPELQVSELVSKIADEVKVGIPMSIPEAKDDTLIATSPMVVESNEKLLDKQLTN